MLELGVRLGSEAKLSCHIALAVSTDFGFQKLTDGGIPADVTKSSSHALSLSSDGLITNTALTFLNFTLGDTGVYRCIATNSTGTKLYSQDMTVFVLKGVVMYYTNVISLSSPVLFYVDLSTAATSGHVTASTGLLLISSVAYEDGTECFICFEGLSGDSPTLTD